MKKKNNSSITKQSKQKKLEGYFAKIIQLTEKKYDREGLKKTPQRAAKYWLEATRGYDQDIKEIITVFKNESKIDQIVGLRNIQFYSMCEHHLADFEGMGYIYYVPNHKIIGISKLARILEVFSNRLQNQERIAKSVADVLEKYLKPKGVAVILRGKHLCTRRRGVNKDECEMETSDLRGCFRKEKETREELFNLIDLK